MKTKEEQLKAHILNKKITDIEFYNINDNYFVFDPETTWVFDGGIQLKFGDDLLSMGYNVTERGMDFSLEKPMTDLLEDSNFYPIEAKQIEGVAALVGQEILDVKIDWGYYHEYDENFELKEEKIFIPTGLLLNFSNDKTLKVALIKFAVTKDPFKIVNAEFSLDGNLYISLHNNLEIATIDNTED